MKKLITIILIIALAVPALAMADDPDPIVGSWYMMIDAKGTVFEQIFGEIYRVTVIMVFTKDGNIYFAEHDYHEDGTIDSPQAGPYGKWEKNGTKYDVSILAAGKDQAFIENDLLYVAAFSEGMYYGFRKMEALDPYYNIYRK